MKIAVLGVGGWGQNHARVLSYLRSEGYIDDVIAVDVNENRAKLIARRFGIEWSTDMTRVLNDDDVLGMIIATPTRLHYDHAKQALEAGKNILVEKPLTENVEQALELKRIAEENNLIITVGFLLRYSTAVRYSRELYQRGELGDILTIMAKRTSFWPNRPLDVGVIRDLAIHDIDLIRFITGGKPKYVFARGGAIKHEYEDYVSMFIEYETLNNHFTHSLIEANWVTPFKIRRMEITAEKGVIIIDLLQHSVKILREDGVYQPNIKYVEPLYAEIKNFVLAINREEKPEITVDDGIIALKVCEIALMSMKDNDVKEVK